MSKETTVNVKAAIRKAVGNGSPATLLEEIVHWCTRKKGGIEYQGRLWSYRQQKDWFQLIGIPEGTGKRAWARLVHEGYILAEMRKRIHFGVREMMMHVALTDKTLAIIGETYLAPAVEKAEQLAKAHAKAEQAAAWAAKTKADYPKGILAAEAEEASAPGKLTWGEIMADPED